MEGESIVRSYMFILDVDSSIQINLRDPARREGRSRASLVDESCLGIIDVVSPVRPSVRPSAPEIPSASPPAKGAYRVASGAAS